MVERKDIRLQSSQEKIKVYEEIHALFLQGKSVEMAEHKSGFPAVTIDCEDIHLLTDIISVEQWWASQPIQYLGIGYYTQKGGQ